MKRYFNLLVCVCTFALVFSAPARGQDFVTQVADTLFGFAELQYPDIFTSAESTHVLIGAGGTEPWQWRWLYRYYTASNTYLAVNEKEFSVYVYGPPFGPDITRVGTFPEVLKIIGAGIVNPGSQECVDAGFPEAGTVASYYGSDYSRALQFITSWQDGDNGTTLIQEQHLVVNDPFAGLQGANRVEDRVISHSGLLYLESSSSEYDQPVHRTQEYLPVSRIESQYNPGLLLGPASRFCVGQIWVSPPVSMTESLTPALAGRPPILESGESPWSIGRVDAVNVPLQVQAGHFVTVEATIFRPWEILTRWTDVVTGIVVKEEAYFPGLGDWSQEVRKELQ